MTSSLASASVPSAIPDRVVASECGKRLLVTFADGAVWEIAASRLRLACRCAHCTRARIEGRAVGLSAETAIEAIVPVGAYGVNIVFSDGHGRGIYPWGYIAELAAA